LGGRWKVVFWVLWVFWEGLLGKGLLGEGFFWVGGVGLFFGGRGCWFGLVVVPGYAVVGWTYGDVC